MATLSPHNLPSMFHEKDDDVTMANAIAYHCLTMFLQDCKDIVTSSVRTSINTQLRSLDQSEVRRGKARKNALKQWCKSDKPLSWGSDAQSTSDTYRQLLIILNNNVEGQPPLLKTSPESYTYMNLAQRLINISQKNKAVAPVSPQGSFFPSLGLAIKRIHKCISSSDDKSHEVVINVFGKMLKKMDIHFVPWHKAEGNNTRAYAVQGDWWLMLKPGSSALINRRIAKDPGDLHADVANQAHRVDKHAPWNLANTLQEMGPLWKKVVLPSDWDLKHASLVETQPGHKNHYVKETYEYVRNIYDGELWWHHLALIWGILFSKIIPYLFMSERSMPTDLAISGPQLIAAVRKLPWLRTRSENHKGLTNPQPFVTMLPTAIIALLNSASPLRQRMGLNNGAFGEGWTTKHGK
jgi:hypothetical protein